MHTLDLEYFRVYKKTINVKHTCKNASEALIRANCALESSGLIIVPFTPSINLGICSAKILHSCVRVSYKNNENKFL